MNWTLEVVCVPVTDVDRAKAFYGEQLGFPVDFDSSPGETRVIQITPPGSGCSICLVKGVSGEAATTEVGTGPVMVPGSLQGVQLVVNDLRAAHATLIARGVALSPIQVFDREGQLQPAAAETDLNNVGFFFFQDPDGNGWAVQQITSRP